MHRQSKQCVKLREELHDLEFAVFDLLLAQCVARGKYTLKLFDHRHEG